LYLRSNKYKSNVHIIHNKIAIEDAIYATQINITYPLAQHISKLQFTETSSTFDEQIQENLLSMKRVNKLEPGVSRCSQVHSEHFEASKGQHQITEIAIFLVINFKIPKTSDIELVFCSN